LTIKMSGQPHLADIASIRGNDDCACSLPRRRAAAGAFALPAGARASL
jgi:hypothetical protein